MWFLASTILEEKNGVLSLPWDKSGTPRLVYDGESAPPCQVIVQQAGTLKCSCPKFKPAMIRAHSLIVINSWETRKGKANEKKGPLMEIQPSSTATYSLPVDDFSSMAASALLALSGSRSSSMEGDYFSLKSLEGTQVRMCYGCAGYTSTARSTPTSKRRVCR